MNDSVQMSGETPSTNLDHPPSRTNFEMPGLAAMIQAPIQALLRPSMWLPGLKNLHSHRERWNLEGVDKRQAARAILEATKALNKSDPTDAYYDIHKISEDFVRILVFTWAEWVDVVEINLCTGEVVSFSSGVIPPSVPFAFILNTIFFWVPFYDSKFNRDRLKLIRDTMEITIESTDLSDDRC